MDHLEAETTRKRDHPEPAPATLGVVKALQSWEGAKVVLEVVDVHFIRHRHAVQGWSVRKLAKTLGHSRRTIRKYLLAEDPVPRYQRKKPRSHPALDAYRGVIDHLLAEDERNSPSKQRLTALRVYELVQGDGYRGSLRTVERYVREKRHKAAPAFLPLAFAAGQVAQCDWGKAYVDVGGRRIEVQLFCLRLCASGASFVMAFKRQTQEAFFEGHRQAFEFLGGVPLTIWYDNLKAAVNKILVGKERVEQKAFVALRTHYRFEAHFCTPGEEGAHEKGLVEGLVGYARRRFLTPVPQVSSLDELNEHLRQHCLAERSRRIGHREAPVGELWEQELAAMIPLPPAPFQCCRTVPATVTGFATVRLEHARYSVPARLVGQNLLVKAFVDRIEVLEADRCVAVHPRRYDGGESLQWEHYLDLLERRPGAVANARVFTGLDAHHVAFRQRCLEGPRARPREFLRVLRLREEFPADVVSSAVADAVAAGAIQADAVRQLCLRRMPQNASPPPLPPEQAPPLPPREPNVHQYNRLLGRRVG